MSSLQYDKHTLCLSCREATCSMDLRCVECTTWSTDEMVDYFRHRKSLVFKGKKKLSVTTASSSSPSVPPSATPSVTSASPAPTLPSIADDEKIKSYVQSVLANLLNQQSSQASLGNNQFFSAPLEVPDIPPPGSTEGRGSESLKRGRFASPSDVVPPVSGDVMPPINVSMPYTVASWGVARVPRSPYPPSGDFTPVSGDSDQLHSLGVSGFTLHVVSVDVHDVPKSVASFDPTSLLFPFSDSGVSSLSSLPPSLAAASLLSSLPPVLSAPLTTVPLFSLPSVVPSVLPFSSSVLAPSSSAPSSFVSFSSSYPSGLVSLAPSLPVSAPPLAPSSSSFPVAFASALLGSLLSPFLWHRLLPPGSPLLLPLSSMILLQFRLGFWSCLPNTGQWLVGFVLQGGITSQLMFLLISLTFTLTFALTSLLVLASLQPYLLLLLRLWSLFLPPFLLFAPPAPRPLHLSLLLAPFTLPFFTSLLLRWLRCLLLLLFLCNLPFLFLRLLLFFRLSHFLSALLASLLGLQA